MSRNNRLSVSTYLETFPASDSHAALDLFLGELGSMDMEGSEGEFNERLCDIKRRFDRAWAHQRFIVGVEPAGLGTIRSEFAAQSIDKALEYAWQSILKINRITQTPLKGLFILGLGKLGGYDLNFSSDVDIICFYDEEKFPVPDSKGKNYIAHKVMQCLTRLLHPKNPDQLIWRVDWRLRPEASATGFAITTAEAENFYFYRAQPWHRLAMIKARRVAGCAECADIFLKNMTPFLWRRNLDYTAIEEIGYLKRRINLEHPNLRIERTQPTPITQQLSGFNVKLGRGGIREIEFIVNALQLIWGGKKYELRSVMTMQTLRSLASLGHVLDEDVKVLTRAYQLYRKFQDAIQLVDNAQTHIVPDGDELDKVLRILDFNLDELAHEIYQLRLKVNEIFERFFHLDDQDAEDNVTAVSANERDDISVRGHEIIESWQNGFDSYGLQPAQFSQFRQLGRQCLDYVNANSNDVDHVVKTMDRFFSRLSRSHQYFSLLAQNEGIFAALIDPLLYSPHMTGLLEQSPHIIDVFLDPQSPVNLGATALKDFKPDPAYIFAGELYETRLERLRRFVNENLFSYYHIFMRCGPAPQLFKQLTELAAITLEASIDIVCQNLGYEAPPMAVLAMGKMGTGHMSPQSDLDLVFVFDDGYDFERASKIVRRIQTALTVKLQEGIAYELDMRLRPSGRSGPAAVSFESFTRYHDEKAKTWEHIALYSARCVAGNIKMQQKVDAAAAHILTRPRDVDQCRHDAGLMWARIYDQRVEASKGGMFADKMADGGLMQAEYVQATQQLLGGSGQSLQGAINFWRVLQLWERLLSLKGQMFGDVPPQYKEAIIASVGAKNAEEMSKMASQYNDNVIEETQRLFGDLSIDKMAAELPIKWA